MLITNRYHCCKYYNLCNKNLILFFVNINDQSGESNHSVVSRFGGSRIVQQRSFAVAD